MKTYMEFMGTTVEFFGKLHIYTVIYLKNTVTKHGNYTANQMNITV